MQKKQVFFHQIQAPSWKNLMPLAAGNIVSKVKSIQPINENYCFHIKILRQDPYKAVGSYGKPDILAFSTYLWNFRQSLEIARIGKEANPNALVVFGGPMISLSQRSEELKSLFVRFPFIDIVVHGMGEWAFSEILLELLGSRDWNAIAAISYKNPESPSGFTSTNPPVYGKDLSELPSPFLDGTFEQVLAEYGSQITGALWETNRGCPFRCTFCCQGNEIFNSVLNFDMDRLCAELEWMADKKIEYIAATDANFGIHKRDIELIRKIVDLKSRTDYPKTFLVNWLKNSSKTILQICEMLGKVDLFSRVTLSHQSFNEETLRAVKRKNINLSTYDELIRETARTGVPTYLELILGLPEESYESFVAGLEKAMNKNINHTFVIYLCRLLAGTEMATTASIQKYGLETRPCVVAFERQEYIQRGVDEYEEIIVGTSTMPVSEWRKAHAFGCAAMALYNYRLAFFVFNYLREEYSFQVIDIIKYIMEKVVDDATYETINKSIKIVAECQESILRGEHSMVLLEITGESTFQAHEAMFIMLLKEIDKFYNELWLLTKEYLNSRGIAVDTDVLNEVFLYQRIIIPTWKGTTQRYQSFKFNIPQYFQALTTGEKGITISKEDTLVEIQEVGVPVQQPVEFIREHLTQVIFNINNIKVI